MAVGGLPPKLQVFLAESSGLNTLCVAEEALRAFGSLLKVFILGAPPRVDDQRLQFLANHRSAFLAWKIEQSPLKEKLKHCPLESLKITNESDATILFGRSDGRRTDGIHMVGQCGKKLFTGAVFTAIENDYP